jgi:hypothetical protein
MTVIQYYLHGGRRPPADREILAIGADGAFTMWRSIGANSYPPAPVGRYAGRLPARRLTALQRAAAAAAATGDLHLTPEPDSSFEDIDVDGVRAKMGSGTVPKGPWGALAGRLRTLLGELTAFPRAVVQVEVASNGRTARLVQHGPEALRLDLSALAVEAVLWRKGNAQAFWNAPPASLGEVTAGPGWSLDLPFDHGFSVTARAKVVAYVAFTAYDGESAILVKTETCE